MTVVALFAVSTAAAAAPASAGGKSSDRQEAGGGETRFFTASRIPEPLVFDLVRPLNARRGEVEVNSLFQQSLAGRGFRDRTLDWAPEIEWAFADGYAFEAELPMEGDRVRSYKFALQGRIQPPGASRLIHGWQVIGKSAAEGRRRLTTDALYLAGYRFNPHWSVFSMTGVRFDDVRRGGAGRRAQGLFNPSVFCNVAPRLILGVETNTEFGGGRPGYLLAMPQAHVALSTKQTLQLGLGGERIGSGGGLRPAAALRLIQEL